MRELTKLVTIKVKDLFVMEHIATFWLLDQCDGKKTTNIYGDELPRFVTKYTDRIQYLELYMARVVALGCTVVMANNRVTFRIPGGGVMCLLLDEYPSDVFISFLIVYLVMVLPDEVEIPKEYAHG